MPFLQPIIHLAQEPSVSVIKSLHDIIQPHTYLRSVHGTIEVSIYIAALVGFGQEVMKVKQGNRIVFDTKMLIRIEVTANTVNLAVSNQQSWNLLLPSR